MTDIPALDRLANLERQSHAILFLSAANMIANLTIIVLWAMVSLI